MLPPLSLLSTASGALVAGVLVYAVHESMKDQTRYMVTTMHQKADALGAADTDFDPASGQRRPPPSSYHPRLPTYWEEMQARWNVREMMLTNSTTSQRRSIRCVTVT